MKEMSRIKPREIYVDWGRDYTTIWTNTREVFVLNEKDTISIAEQIKNLVSYVLVNEETGEKVQLQDIRVAIDIMGNGNVLKDTLEMIGIQCEGITSGAWLKRLCRRQDVVYVNNLDYKFKQKINNYKLI